jgi:hypothetical protein
MASELEVILYHGDETRYDKTHQGVQKHTKKNMMSSPKLQYITPPHTLLSTVCSSYK